MEERHARENPFSILALEASVGKCHREDLVFSLHFLITRAHLIPQGESHLGSGHGQSEKKTLAVASS